MMTNVLILFSKMSKTFDKLTKLHIKQNQPNFDALIRGVSPPRLTEFGLAPYFSSNSKHRIFSSGTRVISKPDMYKMQQVLSLYTLSNII